MDILSLPIDVIAKLALELNLPDILRLCETNSKFNYAICLKDSFWLNKLLKDFPDYKQLNLNKTYREIYKVLYNLTILKQKLGLFKNVYGLYNLKELNLSFSGLIEIPKEIENLHNLQNLYLVGNEISEVAFYR